MLKLASISIAALAASSAFAQVADPSASSPAPAPTQQQPATVDPAAPAQPGSAADPSAAPGAASGAASSPVAAVIESGFATYDKDKSGSLSGAEFKQWIADLKTQEMTSEGKKADPAAAKQYAGTALKAADKNKDGSVSKEELTAFLSG